MATEKLKWPFTVDVARKRIGRRRVIESESYIQTYNVILRLECGHRKRMPVSAKRWDKGYRGPETTECRLCIDAELKRMEAE